MDGGVWVSTSHPFVGIGAMRRAEAFDGGIRAEPSGRRQMDAKDARGGVLRLRLLDEDLFELQFCPRSDSA
jgi:hypothetical protein